MVFEPALTRQDWLGLVAFGLIILIAVIIAVIAVRAAGRQSRRTILPVCALCTLCGVGMGKLFVDRLAAFSRIEFTPREAIVSGVANTVRLPLTESAQVEVSGNVVRLVSGGASAVLPDSAEWASDNLVVDADYLANEFEGRSR